MGERTPLALIDAPASGRMAVGEAITNLAAAAIAESRHGQALGQLDGAGGTSGRGCRALRYRARGRDGALPCARYQHSRRQGLDVDAHHLERGRQAARGDGTDFACRVRVCRGSRRAPRADGAATLRSGAHRAASSRPRQWAEPSGRLGTGTGLRQARRRRPRPGRSAKAEGLLCDRAGTPCPGSVLAYHDRSDGGLFATLVEMAFAARCGLAIAIDELPGAATAALFNEELGAVMQVRAADRHDTLSPRSRRRDCAASPSASPPRRARADCTGEPHPARRIARRLASRVVAHHARAAAAARFSGGCRSGIRAPARRRRPGLGTASHLRPGNGHRSAIRLQRSAAAGGDPARAGGQRTYRGRGGVRPRRFRRLRRAHDRPDRGPD